MTEEELYREYQSKLSRLDDKRRENKQMLQKLEEEEERVRTLLGRALYSLELLRHQWGNAPELYQLQEDVNAFASRAQAEHRRQKEESERKQKQLDRQEEEYDQSYQTEKQRLETGSERGEENEAWEL